MMDDPMRAMGLLEIVVATEPDDNGTYMATCPQLPEVTTFGVDRLDAAMHCHDAIYEALAARSAEKKVQ
jgi:antitoxin HicB